MAGEGDNTPPVRCCHVGDRIGVLLTQRTTFYSWLESEGLLVAPYSPFWHESPWAGCVALSQLRQRLQQAINTGERLPFTCIHIPELNHDLAPTA